MSVSPDASTTCIHHWLISDEKTTVERIDGDFFIVGEWAGTCKRCGGPGSGRLRRPLDKYDLGVMPEDEPPLI